MLKLAATLLALLVDGVAYGMVLFLMSVGLTITLGVMRIANLAHCGFAMLGGYIALWLVASGHFSLFTALPLAILGTMLFGAALERSVYRWVYTTGQLGQILMTLGLVFIFVASGNLFFGSDLHAIALPEWLSGRWTWGTIAISSYRGFIILVSVAIAAACWAILEFTDFGARLRAAVDNPRMARCIGIDVPGVFSITFSVGCGLAAAAGVLGTQIMPLEPWYPFEYLVPLLMVVAVGGLGSLKGSFYAALMLGVIDTLGRYYVPAAGAFVIYLAVVGLLLWRPQGVFARASA
ncbi:MAG TPA: branched-chain amino acid ABC transporter permease [Stellaceae bacterium]|nr:branched-chain amino acid ABC transporter permease [Stellaceae bacterium]